MPARPKLKADTSGISDAELDAILEGLAPPGEDAAAFDARLKRGVEDALANPSPDIPADEAFARVYARIEEHRARRSGN